MKKWIIIGIILLVIVIVSVYFYKKSKENVKDVVVVEPGTGNLRKIKIPISSNKMKAGDCFFEKKMGSDGKYYYEKICMNKMGDLETQYD